MWIIIILLITAPFYFYGHELANIDESCVVVKVGKEGQRCDISSESLNTAQKAEFGSPEASIECNPSTNPEVNRLLNKYFKSCEEVKIIKALAFAECDGKQICHNRGLNRNGTIDFGWLGVNSIHRNKGETIEAFEIRMYNLEENIKLASKIYNQRKSLTGDGFQAWSSYGNMKFKTHLATLK